MIEKISMDLGYVDFILTENIPTNYKKENQNYSQINALDLSNTIQKKKKEKR